MTTTQHHARPRPGPADDLHRSPGRVVGAVLSGLVLMLGALVLLAGGVTLVANALARDGSGYLMSDATPWTSPGYAVQTETVLVHSGPMGFTVPHELLGRFHARAQPTGDLGVFIGIGSDHDVRRYLRGVARTTMSDPYADASSGRFVDGGSPRVAPTDATFWVASSVGTEPQELTWDPRPGAWRLVVMNAEGTTPVNADVSVGAEAPGVRSIGWTLVAVGVILAGAASAALLHAVRTPTSTRSTATDL